MTRRPSAARKEARLKPMSSEEPDTGERKKRPRRRWRKVLGVLLLLLAAGLVWLNGPGWRWLGGIALRHSLAKADLEAEFELKGTLLGGVRVEKLKLSGGVPGKPETLRSLELKLR